MFDMLRINREHYEGRTYAVDGRSIACRAYVDVPYCIRPVDPIQRLNVFVPEGFFVGGSVNGYDAETAPVFLPNSVGGYLPGPAEEPGINKRTGMPNTLFTALERGCVVVSGGVRGRTSGTRSTEFFEGGSTSFLGEDGGVKVGRAPALVVDMKAIIRFLRHNSDVLPGNVERIITNGTSAGGALSALAGSTGNDPSYEPYLDRIGAADARDDVFASSCYCPIHNLENADAAYEWQFSELADYHRTKHIKTGSGLRRVSDDGVMSSEQMNLSAELKDLFPAYVNSLGLVDKSGRALTLDEGGRGSFLEYMIDRVIESAQHELDTHFTAECLTDLAALGSEVERLGALTIRDGRAVALDWDAYVRAITRMKPTPAFDALDLSSPENEEFGDERIEGRHFSAFGFSHSSVESELASPEIVRMMNPVACVGMADLAPHWRIRHGSFDRDTSLAIPAILALILQGQGVDVDFALPWGIPHCGDYDQAELFDWIDGICG